MIRKRLRVQKDFASMSIESTFGKARARNFPTLRRGW
jgi:hypothetical protein